jgi:hypothetical protein
MKNSGWTIFDHKCWQFLVLTISFWGYLILTHSHWRPFGSVCNWGIPPQIGHSTGKVIIIHWKVIYTNMFHFHPFSNPLESDMLMFHFQTHPYYIPFTFIYCTFQTSRPVACGSLWPCRKMLTLASTSAKVSSV